MHCNQIMALKDAFEREIQARAPPLLIFFIFLFLKDTLLVFFLPIKHGVEVTDLRWVSWSGDRARRGPTVCGPTLIPTWAIRGAPPRFPIWGYYTGSSTGCGNGWPPPTYPHHHRGQSPSNTSSTPSKVIIDKGWHANVDTGEIILWGQSLLLSCFWRGTPCLMYKYCGGTLFPYLLSDYKRNGVETIRDAGSHVSFL